MQNNKQVFFLFFFIFCLSFSSFAAIDADVDIATYYQEGTPFIDVRLHIVGSTLKEKEVENNMLETRVKVLITVIQADQIVDFKKYGLVSPAAELVSDFIDLRRFVLKPGDYMIKVELVDQLNSKNMYEHSIDLKINSQPAKLSVSKMLLLADVKPSEDVENPFYKYGNVVEPAAFGFFHESMEKLIVFSEIYNSNLTFEEDYAVKLTLINNDDAENKDVLTKYKRFKASEKEVFFDGFPILDVPSGNYTLQLDLINSKQESQYTQAVSFQRSNPSKDRDILLSSNLDLEGSFINKLSPEELEYNLKALAPRLNQMEITTINILLEEKNLKGQRFYLYNYWTIYDPITTEETFNTYLKIVKAVDRMFYNTVGRGFETDRGYIFLKYGKPKDVISVENEPSAPPYEIWFYDKIDQTGDVNVRFLFYNPSLGGNDYSLLHSTCRLERQNPRWEVELYSDAPNEIVGNRVDATTMGDNFNRRAREYFEDNN